MTLFYFLAVLIALALIATAINRHGARVIDEPWRTWLIYAVVIVGLVFILYAIGVFDLLSGMPLPRFHK
jgi:hypothetical protein